MRVRVEAQQKVGQDAFEISKHFVIPIPNYTVTFAFKPCRSSRVTLHAMLTAIDLDYQTSLDAAEVDDIGTDRPLALEFEAPEPPSAKLEPHDALRLCHLLAQWTGVRAD